MNPYIDIAVHGEGEITFLKLLEAYPANDWSEIPGVSWIDSSGNFSTHPKSDRIRELSIIPSPYLEGVFEPLLSLDSNAEWLALWETNRGCPFHCTFCVWGISAMDKVRVFPLERVLEEIEYIVGNRIGIFITKRNVKSLSETMEFIMKNYASIQESIDKNKLPTREKFILQMSNILS